MLKYTGGFFLGVSLGANDGANVFGTAVASRMVKYFTAVMLASAFILIGSFLEGSSGIETLRNITTQNAGTAFVCTLAAAITVTTMTLLRLPVSTSQAAMGAIPGIGFMNNTVNLQGLQKVILCWIGTPIGGIFFAVILYMVVGKIFKILSLNLFSTDTLIHILLVLGGCYGAYAFGANNVANVVGVYASDTDLSLHNLALVGGLSISLGVILFSKPVMMTIGENIVKLDAFSSMIVLYAHSLTVHLYAMIGFPVSSSQAVVGAVLGIGIIKGLQTVHGKVLTGIAIGWIATPAVSAGISVLLFYCRIHQLIN